MWQGKGTKIANTNLKSKNKVGRITLLDLELTVKTTVIKIVWYW